MNRNWTEYFRRLLPDVLEELRTYVEMESPTHD
ncbi:hypothetical protein BSPP4475_07135 [Brevibacillus aydinogluensis]|uniref:Uncharacterized protein n=2 Tax=Brevibacillus TaxID=55080 RepID=A0AA48M7I1_9BACL|nr:hypothetical protein BSPP4475_07135 [Brevibacillus aydinogluensis]